MDVAPPGSPPGADTVRRVARRVGGNDMLSLQQLSPAAGETAALGGTDQTLVIGVLVILSLIHI